MRWNVFRDRSDEANAVSRVQKRTAAVESPQSHETELAGGIHNPILLTKLWQFRERFRDGRDATKILRSALKIAREHFDADESCLLTLAPGAETAEVQHRVPAEAEWERELFGGFLRGTKIAVPRDTMLARLRRRDRMWGALAVRGKAHFSWQDRSDFSSLGEVVNELLAQLDQARIAQVRVQIDRKILEQVRPKHLFYKILHGIRSLIEYDHSAAILICDDDRGSLEVVAEQIAWHKGKSGNVGLAIPLDRDTRGLLESGTAFGFDRVEGSWKQWIGEPAASLVELLDYNPAVGSELFPAAENSLLCLPLVTRDGLMGALKVASAHGFSLRQYEAELLLQFLPQAGVALQNLRRTESLELQVLNAERKYAMAELARGVAHDVNNALGAMLPLVQQMQADLADDLFEPSLAADDLKQIERSLHVCRRIFSGMLKFARNETRNASEVSLYVIVDSAVTIFRQSLARQRIELVCNVPEDLPTFYAVQADIEQLVLNLVSNARDAMEPGDVLTIESDVVHAGLRLRVSDSGCGIPEEHLAKIQEPFFTTKETGNGLGLAICRSIVAQLRGQFHIESRVGVGTRVTVTFPLIEQEPR